MKYKFAFLPPVLYSFDIAVRLHIAGLRRQTCYKVN